jgi:1-acyl-sn-glycerol-3-phosphate acyltransferase
MTTIKKPDKIFIFSAKIFGFFLFNFYYKIHIKNKQNIPLKGPVLIVANHTSFFDSIIIGYINYIPLYYIAKEELFKNKIFAFILRLCGAVPISRFKNPSAGLIKTVNLLKEGGSILFFPEGTRSVDNKLLPAKLGTGFIIYHSKVPVIPVFIKGFYDLNKKWTVFLRPKSIYINVGKPIFFDSIPYEEIASKVMEAIKNLSFS